MNTTKFRWMWMALCLTPSDVLSRPLELSQRSSGFSRRASDLLQRLSSVPVRSLELPNKRLPGVCFYNLLTLIDWEIDK